MAGGVVYKDFVDLGESLMKDNTSHGTSSVDMILRMCQDAKLYVARVFETKHALGRSEQDRMAEVGSFEQDEIKYTVNALC